MKPIYSQANPPDSICLIRLSAIGDVCHTVAVVQQLQKYWPDTAITWIIGKVEYRLLAGLPGVEFIVFDKKSGLKGFYDLYQKLKSREFDVLLHMQMAIRSSLISLLVKAKYKIGFDRLRAKDCQWLFTNVKIDHTARQHVLDSLLSFTHTLGLPNSKPHWHVPIASSDLEIAKNIITKPKVLVITPASSVSVRNWTLEGYIRVAEYAASHYDMQVIFCGGTSAAEIQMSAVLDKYHSKNITNLIGKTSLKQLLAILSLADLLIAPDTGPSHMATMVNTPVISLFANTNPERAAPYNSRHLVVSEYPQALLRAYGKKVHELPWSKRVWDAKAMHLIRFEQVREKLDLMMASHRQLELA